MSCETFYLNLPNHPQASNLSFRLSRIFQSQPHPSNKMRAGNLRVGTRVRDKIVLCITKMLVRYYSHGMILVPMRIIALIEYPFPLALANFKEMNLMNEVPSLQLNTPTKKRILSRLLLDNGGFALLDKPVAHH